jgi:dsRNA-specific ribonuclease/ankyrin repeat protein
MLTAQEIEFINQEFSLKLAYKFENTSLLIQALTRESALGIHVPKNAPYFESLEFLGDRAMNLAVAGELFSYNKEATPSELNDRYVALTRNSDGSKRNGGPLYRVAKTLKLENYILKSDTEDLAQYGDRGKTKKHNKKTRECNLSDHVEALIGAIYLDSNYNMRIVIAFVKKYWVDLGLNEEAVSESSFGNSSVNDSINAISKVKQNNIFIEAAKINNWPQAYIALTKGAEVSTPGEQGKNALHYFSAWGNTEAIVELLNRGMEIDARDGNKWTAALHSASRGKYQALRILLSEGASGEIEVITESGPLTILTLAAKKSSNQIIAFITINYLHLFTTDQLNYAATQTKENNKLNVQALMTRAIDQKAKNTLLFSAVGALIENPDDKEKIKAVKEIISNGADIRIRNADNETIFHLIANSASRIELISFILKAKLKFDGIILNNLSNNIFSLSAVDTDERVIDELENLSFKHADLSGISFVSIKKFTNIIFIETILCDVNFHPEAKFINTSFKDSYVDGTCPNIAGMDEFTRGTLPEKWNPTAIEKPKNMRIISIFSPSQSSATVSTGSNTVLTKNKTL